MKFFSPDVALYFNRSTILPCIEHCCHVLAVAPNATWNCYISYKNGYAGLLVLHLLPLLNPWLIVEMYPAEVFSIDITLVDVHLNWINRFHFLVLKGDQLVIMTDCMIFQSPFLDVTRMSYVNSFFPHTARPWNSLPIECFPLTYDLNGFKFRINRHLLPVGSFKTDFLYPLIFLCFFFL